MNNTILVKFNRDSKYYADRYPYHYHLTKGKIYKAIIDSENPSFYIIKNNIGKVKHYSKGFFIKVNNESEVN